MNKMVLVPLVMAFSLSAHAADFTVNLTPADSSVSDQQVNTISSSKITAFASSVISAMSSTLSSYLAKTDMKAVVLKKLNASQTYNPPAGVLYLKVKVIGGGGGGNAGGSAGTSPQAGNGGVTSFGTDLVANGGIGGIEGGSADGGTFSCGAITSCWGMQGSVGQGFGYLSNNANGGQGRGGMGGMSILGGNGWGASDRAGGSAVVNSGSGGAGGDSSSTTSGSRAGSGGGAGGNVEAVLAGSDLKASFVVVIGSKGQGSTSINASGYKGGDGATGTVIVEEHYQ